MTKNDFSLLLFAIRSAWSENNFLRTKKKKKGFLFFIFGFYIIRLSDSQSLTVSRIIALVSIYKKWVAV
jgi:hypothetical protein